MSTFTITRLVGDRAIVKGTDVFGVEGSVTVFTTQWDEVNANTAYDQATEAFEAAVEEFFAPLTKAAEAMHQSVSRPTDSIGYVVLREGQAAVPAQSEHIVKLNRDSVILRLVEQGDFDRLVWVGDELEVLADGGQPIPGVTGGVALPADADPS
jgi:hypothetical protein